MFDPNKKRWNAVQEWQSVRKGLINLRRAHRLVPKLPDCSDGAPCNSRLCPMCVAYAVGNFGHGYVTSRRNRNEDWAFVTLGLKAWRKVWGDFTPFDIAGARRQLDELVNRLASENRSGRSAVDQTAPVTVIGMLKICAGAGLPVKLLYADIAFAGVDQTTVAKGAADFVKPFGGFSKIHRIRLRRPDYRRDVMAGLLRNTVRTWCQPRGEELDPNKAFKPDELAELACNMGEGNVESILFLRGVKLIDGMFVDADVRATSQALQRNEAPQFDMRPQVPPPSK